MIELDRHIEILLLSNDCVIVPNLGGFMTHSVNAYYDENENLFLPPMRTLGFNAQLTINDSLLAQSYVEAYDISFPEAIRRIEDEVAELKERIATEGMYELTDIGTLSVNGDGRYEFKPCEAGILTPSLYGLSSFEMKKISIVSPEIVENTVAAIKSKKNTEQRISILPMMKLEKNENDAKIKEKQDKEENKLEDGNQNKDAIVINMQAVRNAVAVAAAIICFFMFTLPLGNSSLNNVAESNIHNGVIYKLLSERPSQTVEKIQNSTTAIQKQASPAVEAKHINTVKEVNHISASTTENIKAEPYCIVLASHVTKRNAQNYVDQLQTEGYNDARMVINGKTVRVVYGNYENKNKAYHELNRLHEREHFEQAWVYEIKGQSF